MRATRVGARFRMRACVVRESAAPWDFLLRVFPASRLLFLLLCFVSKGGWSRDALPRFLLGVIGNSRGTLKFEGIRGIVSAEKEAEDL